MYTERNRLWIAAGSAETWVTFGHICWTYLHFYKRRLCVKILPSNKVGPSALHPLRLAVGATQEHQALSLEASPHWLQRNEWGGNILLFGRNLYIRLLCMT